MIPKISSFLDTLQELDADISVVTETWLQDSNEQSSRTLADFEARSEYKLIRRDRTQGMRGGGVAIAYNENKIQMSRARLPHSKHEVVAAIGRRQGQRKKILILGIYVPPWYNAAQNSSMYNYINDCLVLLTARYEDPYIILAGDFNRRDIRKVTQNFIQIKPVLTGPTRNDAVLDIIATNFNKSLVDAGTTDPLQADTIGAPGDHRTVFATFRMPRVPQYEIEQYSYYRIDEKGTEKMKEILNRERDSGWANVLKHDDVNDLVEELHKLIENGMAEAYEKKTRKKKSSEPVWMADWIRDLIEDRRELFRKEGRSPRWETFKQKIVAIVKSSKNKYFSEIRAKFVLNKDPSKFFAYAQAFMGGNGEKGWDVRSMDPTKSDEQLTEWLADYFNGISSEYAPLSPAEVPTSYHRSIPKLEQGDVIKMINKAKKKTSSVPGDLPPEVFTDDVELVAIPVTKIFNKIIEQNKWPDLWKREHVTVIPKTKHASEPSQCRNISCTNFFSKVFESIVLAWAREEVVPKANQFGGEPKCGTEHFMVESLHYITSALEDNRNGVVVSSVDFSKAFNRLDHLACLKSFQKLGASTEIIQLLACFLMGRTMTVKVGQARSKPRPVNAGAPQGSVLGCYLFNVGIDDIEEECLYSQDMIPTEARGATNDYPAVSTPTRVRPTQAGPQLSPIREEEEGTGLQIGPRVANIPPWLLKPKDKKLKAVCPCVKKFVDDGIHLSVINLRAETTLVDSDGNFFKETHAQEAQDMLRHITRRAGERGMQVNDSKTGLMCISAARTFIARAALKGRNNETINSTQSLKFLGLTLDQNCTFGTHVEAVAAKLRSKTWLLSRLKRRGMTVEELTKVYCSVIRPSAEYAAVAWHPMITMEQSDSIEKQQVMALKNILGVGISAEKMRSQLNIERLSERRGRRMMNFAVKCAESERFCDWFPQRTAPLYSRREGISYRHYVEEPCRTERHYNSPLMAMRRKLNQSIGR